MRKIKNIIIFGGILIILVGWVLSASRIGPIESCLTDCTRYPLHEANRFTVLDLNILHGFPGFEHLFQRLDIIAAQITQTDPDFVILQEVPWTWKTRSAAKYLAKQTGMNYVYLPANGNRWTILFSEGEAILSKYPLKDVEIKELKPKAGLFEHRVVLKVAAAVPWGELDLISTHLTNGETEINEKQAHDLYQMVSLLSENSVIVAGDFNATEDLPQMELLSTNWIDTYRISNPNDPGFTCCVDVLTGPNIDTQLEERIDFLFLVPNADTGIRLIESERIFAHPYPVENGQLWASDHVGILSRFEVIQQNTLMDTE